MDQIPSNHFVKDDLSLIDIDDPSAELPHQTVFMGYHQNGSPDVIDALQQFYDLIRKFRIDVSRRLVRNNQLRVVDQCASGYISSVHRLPAARMPRFHTLS